MSRVDTFTGSCNQPNPFPFSWGLESNEFDEMFLRIDAPIVSYETNLRLMGFVSAPLLEAVTVSE